MDFNNVIRFMSQQLDALKNIEDLLAHDEKQNPAAHTVKPEEMEHLKNYVADMKRAAETARGLAEYYQNLKKAQTENKEATEKPKPKRSRKKTKTPAAPPAEPSAEPAANEPRPNGEQAEQTIIEADAKHETNPAPQVPVANPEPAQSVPDPTPEPKPAQQNIPDLIASISIDNLQS